MGPATYGGMDVTSFADALGEGVILMHVGDGARRKVSPTVFRARRGSDRAATLPLV